MAKVSDIFSSLGSGEGGHAPGGDSGFPPPMIPPPKLLTLDSSNGWPLAPGVRVEVVYAEAGHVLLRIL